MKKKLNIIQFTPYFSPHIGWVEKVSEWIFLKWTQWISSIYSWNIWQQWVVYNNKKKNIIDNKTKVFFPSFDIIDNFPIPMLWTRNYRSSHKKLLQIIKQNSDEDFVIITHTRFFISSYIWGIFARKNKLKWVHIEHGSDYVKLSSRWKSSIAYLYDKTFGKWVIKNSDQVLAISSAASSFVKTAFSRGDVDLWYRGTSIPEKTNKKETKVEFLYIGRLVHLKWVSDVLEAFSKIQWDSILTIIGEGEERKKLEQKTRDLKISSRVIFVWGMNHDLIIQQLVKKKYILINPSYQEWMPTTVIEWLATQNVVIASDVWGTREISQENDLILFPAGDIATLGNTMKKTLNDYDMLSWKSYDYLQKNFSWKKSVENLYTLIR